MTAVQPAEYQTLPLALFTVSDLTDALGISRSAEILATTPRAIYTVRNTNVLSEPRAVRLIDEIKKDEAGCRQRLMIIRNLQKARADDRSAREAV